jgi:pimeloyl-ACP methyl ester carboxylesterase
MMGNYLDINGIRLHYLDYPGDGPTLILLHGLTANAHAFEGLIRAGLSPRLRVLAVDLRGRGLSDHPDGPYGVADHVADIIGMMDALGMEQAVVGGHSYGGLLTFYMAAHHAERVAQCVIMDTPAELHPKILDQVKPSLDRLEATFPSWQAYLGHVKSLPYYEGLWDEALEVFYRSDVRENPDGTIEARSSPAHIAAAAAAGFQIDWPSTVERITRPTLMLRAPDSLGPPGMGPIVSREVAERALAWISDARLVDVPGNHITFLFGDSAKKVVEEIVGFVTF